MIQNQDKTSKYYDLYLKKLTKQRRLVSGLTASPSSEIPSLESSMIGPTVFAFVEEESDADAEGVLDLQLLPPPRPSLSLCRSLSLALSGDSSLRSREYCLFVSRVSLSDERRLCEGRVPLSRTASGPKPIPPPVLPPPLTDAAVVPFSSKLVSRMRLESSVTGVLLCERSWSTSAMLGCRVWLGWTWGRKHKSVTSVRKGQVPLKHQQLLWPWLRLYFPLSPVWFSSQNQKLCNK